jgi:hypothetical protein
MTSNASTQASDLGAPIAEYTRNSGKHALSVLISALLIIAGVAMALGGFFSSDSPSGSRFLFLSLGLVYALPGTLWFVSTVRKRDLHVRVFPEGFSYTKGGKTELVRWDEVETVRQAITRVQHTFTVRSCTLQLKDGSKYTFNNALRNVGELIHTTQREVTPRLLSRLNEQYRAGQVVRFGKLAISEAGISHGRKTLPWDQVGSASVSKGVVTIRKRGRLLKWASIDVAQIPNFFVFAHMVGTRAPESGDLTLLAMSVLS